MFDKKTDDKQSKPATSSSQVDRGDLAATSVTSPARACAMIGSTIHIKGDISGGENLVIDGKVDGTIDLSSHELSVGKSGTVKADITAKTVRIDGEVQGDISGHEKVTVSKSGNVRGNIVAPRVTLEDGAKFKGSIDMDPGNGAVAAPKAPKAAEVKELHKDNKPGEAAKSAS
ncbi:polymer-forming cytoskeletal protein [Porticoccus sp. W117]|uniref:bactofilin family protein n=1 Tax=Porticoccus sp. W117 TaxID=3054777 RepID=UPI0025987F73|nr:polymer-forming cytoskeletal protein [Porticoccus sp. W117]MDM3870320.1 polymer-forming cytoskeletal protein [Porticoccus sp. W117]